MKYSYKRFFALALAFALLVMAMPANAVFETAATSQAELNQAAQADTGALTETETTPDETADVTPPEIIFTSKEEYEGLPVIYSRDLGLAGLSSEFFGFSVTDDKTETFADITFSDFAPLAGQGTLEISYSYNALKGFAAPGEGYVSITASDAAGNITTQGAWCKVVDFDAPYYSGSSLEDCLPIFNCLTLYLEQDKPFVFQYSDFVNSRLVEANTLSKIQISTLPTYGQLSFLQDNGEWKTLTSRLLPYTFSLEQIGNGELRYTTNEQYWNGVDVFKLLAEDELGNISATSSATTVHLEVQPQNMPPIVEEIGTITLARNSEPAIIDLAVSDRETEACELIAFASTDASQNNIASVDVLFDKDNNLWQLHIAPIKNAYGSCPVTLTVADAQGGQTAVDWELNITKDSLPVQAVNDAILFEGAGNIIIDALQNDIAYDDVDIKLKRTGKAQFGSVTIDNGMIVYVPDDYAQGILPDYFTYTISRSGKKHKQDILTATVCINDSTAPKIADIAIKRGEGSLWSPSFTLSTRVEDDTVVSSVILKAAASGQIWQPEAVQDKNTYVFTVETGGEFIIEATDIGGNVSTKSITVENIDSIPPTIDLSASTSLREGYLGNNGVFSVLVRDDQSGVASLMVLDDDGKAVEEAIVSSGDGGRYNIDLSALPEGSGLLLAAYDNAGQKTQLELNELRFDQEPPMIEVAFANEDNCYYAPRTFTVTDEKSGVLSVTINGEPLELADAYTLPVSWNEQNTVLIEAVDHVGNTTQLQVQMLGIPSVIDLDAVSDTAALRKISADMRERLNSMNTDDPVYLPGDTPISLLDFLGVLEVEIEMIELLNQPRPLTQAHQPHFEEVSQNLSALNGIQDDYLSPALTQAFTGLWDELQIGNLAHRIDALPEAAPAEFDEALASAVEELVISVSKAPATHLSTEHAQKLENLYDALLAQNNIQSRDEATGVRALGMLSALNVPKNENITRIYLDVQPISQADGITYPIYNHQENDDIVYSSGYTMYVKGETANGTIDIPIKPGSAIVLELPLQEDCDPDAMLAFRKTDGMTKQLLDIAPLERENAQFMSLFTHALEEITIYTRVQAPQEDDPAPLPEDESPAPEQTPETSTPAPEITPEPEQPAQAEQTAKPEPTPAPDATPGGFLAEDEATDAFAAYDETATPISEIPLWPIAAVATITLLIIIIRICFALFNGKSDKV